MFGLSKIGSNMRFSDSPAFTKTPKVPGKLYLKASLFDAIAPCGKEVFDRKRVPLFPAESSGKTESDHTH